MSRDELNCFQIEVFHHHVDGADLDVEREPVQLVFALELFAVGLTHCQLVFSSFENLNLVHDVHSAPGRFSSSGDNDGRFGGGVQLHRLVTVCVVVDNVREPKSRYLNKKCKISNSFFFFIQIFQNDTFWLKYVTPTDTNPNLDHDPDPEKHTM